MSVNGAPVTGGTLEDGRDVLEMLESKVVILFKYFLVFEIVCLTLLTSKLKCDIKKTSWHLKGYNLAKVIKEVNRYI